MWTVEFNALMAEERIRARLRDAEAVRWTRMGDSNGTSPTRPAGRIVEWIGRVWRKRSTRSRISSSGHGVRSM